MLGLLVCLCLAVAGCGGSGAVATIPADSPVAIVGQGVGGQTGTALSVPAGGELQLALAYQTCCVVWVELEDGVEWSLEPQDGVTITEDGLVTVDEDTPDGKAYTVTARWQADGSSYRNEVTVFNPADNPFVGLWSERAQLACASGEEVQPEVEIRELLFFADGTYRVTWRPFEAYVDYEGTYRFDPQTGALSLTAAEINYLPPDFDGEGQYRFDDQGRLVLEGIWLGSPPDQGGPGQCGHIFGQ